MRIASDAIPVVRIGTRTSPLALWQANHVREALLSACPGLRVELVEIISGGDKTLDVPLSQVGGKGLFLKELETALLDREIDLAVHSMKDVTVELPEGLHIPVYCSREDSRDALVSNKFSGLDELPEGAVVGTCSLRRQCQIKANYPRLQLKNLRGNVNTRLQKLDSGQYDAIILAVAGLKRLGMEDRITQVIPTSICLPAVGQGVVGIECRVDDADIHPLILPLNDPRATVETQAERAANARIGGGCHVPVAFHCERSGQRLTLRGLVGELDGSRVLRSRMQGPVSDPVQLGISVAEDLVGQGAKDILDRVYYE